MTQKELADLAGYPSKQSTRTRIEKHIPKMDTLIRLLDSLDLEKTISPK
jgi:hypothetical protein